MSRKDSVVTRNPVTIIAMIVVVGLLAVIFMYNQGRDEARKGVNENFYSMVLDTSRGSGTDHKRSPEDYFTVVKEVEKMETLTRVAVKRSGDGWMFSAFWTGSHEPRPGEKVALKSYTYHFSAASQQLIAFAYPAE